MAISDKLNLTNTAWLSCKYTINMEIIFSDKTVRKLQDIQVTGLYLEKDYDNDHLPVLMIDLMLTKLDRNKVDDNTLFHLIIKQYYLDNDDDTATKRHPKTYLDDTFVRIDFGTQPDTTESLEKKSRDAEGLKDGELSTTDLTVQTTYVLVKRSDLAMTKKFINGVLCNVTMQDAVCWMLSKAGCPNKVLMSNFTNTETQEELLLQPKQLLQQMIFLEEEYGWHKEGTYIFLDFDTFYIIRKNGLPSAWKKNEPKEVCFCISDAQSQDSANNGVIVQNDIIYINVGIEQYHMMDASIVEDQISGTNMILFNTTTGSSSIINSGSKSLDTQGSYTNRMYHGHNPYVENQFKRMKMENNNIWEVTCLNSDISYFTPQRHFTFLSDTTKISNTLKGSYRISNVKTTFIKSGNFFNNTSIVMVKRVEE